MLNLCNTHNKTYAHAKKMGVFLLTNYEGFARIFRDMQENPP